jgi:hypothetical protein
MVAVTGRNAKFNAELAMPNDISTALDFAFVELLSPIVKNIKILNRFFLCIINLLGNFSS